MSLVELIEQYRQQPLTYPDGETCEVELLPPPSGNACSVSRRRLGSP